MPMLLLAGLTTGGGVALLFLSWNGSIAHRFRPALLGWALLCGSAYLWSRAVGTEFGLTIAILLPAVVAWVLTVRSAELRDAPMREKSPRSRLDGPEHLKEVAPSRSWARHLGMFALTVPVSALAAIFASVALASFLPWSDINEMVFALAVMPVLWGCAAYWAVADSKVLRPLLGIPFAALIGAAVVYL